jgi:hypothetical protein
MMCECVGRIYLAQTVTVMDVCEPVHKSWGSIKEGNFLTSLASHYLLKEEGIIHSGT